MLIEIRMLYMVKYNYTTPMVASYLYKFERMQGARKYFWFKFKHYFFHNLFLTIFVQNTILVEVSFKGTLMQIWKSANIFVFVWKQYVEDFTSKYL